VRPRTRRWRPSPSDVAVPPALRAAWVGWAPLVLLALGVAVRLRQWAGGRSLWLDEALIARSLVSRGYLDLVAEPLRGDQAAPVLWLWGVRLSIDLFGDGERSLRLVPLLAGIAALWLTWRLARRLLPDVAVPVAVALAAFSPQLVYYSNEVKPYSLDVVAVLAVALLALQLPWPARPSPRLWRLALAGAVLVWASYAAVLALAGVSVVLVLGRLLRRQVHLAARLCLALSPWLVSLGVSYVAVLSRHRESSVLSSFWASTFPSGPLDLPAWLVRRTAALVDDPLELALTPVAVVLLAVGVARLVRAQGPSAALALAAVPMAVVAAAVSAYPLAGRLSLWLVPLAALALAAVLPSRLDGRSGAGLLVAAAALTAVTAPGTADGLRQLGEVRERQEVRPLLERLAGELAPGDAVFVEVPAQAAFDFYSPRTGVRRDGVITFVGPERLGGSCQDDGALRATGLDSGRVWLVFGHRLTTDGTAREDLLGRAAERATPVRRLTETGAEAWLFDPAAGPAASIAQAVPRDPTRCLFVVRSGG
jgi:hypothetical protein